MKVVFVQTYPVYHDLWTAEEWLELKGRHRWMPGVLAEMGCQVELWGGAHSSNVVESDLNGFASYTIRLFETKKRRRNTKFHYSDELVQHARRANADVYVLKGVDGGIGTHLLRSFLLPNQHPFAFIIGGKYYTRYVPKAELVFYETREQRQLLIDPGWRIWRRSVPDDRLARMPKSIDTDLFRPQPGVEKAWDVISVGRLMKRYKNYDALGMLGDHMRVAVIGTGDAEKELREKYPHVDWLGRKDHCELPEYLNRARLFMHGGRQDYFPRVIAEAASCGLPCVGFREAIKEDVIDPKWGLRIGEEELPEALLELLNDEERLRTMSENARRHSERNWHKRSSRKALQQLVTRMKER